MYAIQVSQRKIIGSLEFTVKKYFREKTIFFVKLNDLFKAIKLLRHHPRLLTVCMQCLIDSM